MVKKEQKPVTVNEDSVALDTVHPNSRPAELPRTKFSTITSVIGHLAQIEDNDLNKFDAVLAQIGHEASKLPAGASKEHNQGTLEMHPSHAVSKAVKEDVETLLAGGEGLSEEFKTKAATLFEAALAAQVTIKEAELQEAFNVQVDEKVKELVVTLSEEVDTFLAYVSKEWLKENKVALEKALKIEIYEDFLAGMKKVFEETYISIPEEKVDIVETLSTQVDELETSLANAIKENATLKTQVNEAARDKVVKQLAEGLTMNDVEKFKTFSDAVDAETLEEFTAKLKVVRESNFMKGEKKASLVVEQMEETNEKPEDKEIDPRMKGYVAAISRNMRQ